MKKKNQGSNYIKLIIVTGVVVLLIICVVVSTVIKKKGTDQSLNQIGGQVAKETDTVNREKFEKFEKEYQAVRIMPRNIMELHNYKGDYSREDLYKSMKVYVDYLAYLNENVTEKTAKSYYEQGKDEFLQITGKYSLEDFEKLVSEIKAKKIDFKDFKYAEVEQYSSYSYEGYYRFVLNLYYGDTETMVSVDVGLAEKTTETGIVIYANLR